MASFTVTRAPYGSGTATAQQFLDGTTVTRYRQNAIAVLDKSVWDASQVQQAMKAIGVYPGCYWDSGAPSTSSTPKYVVGKIEYSHLSVGDTLRWNAVVYVEPNPIQLLPELNFQATHYQETVTQNIKTTAFLKANAPITNTALLPFAEAIEENKGRSRLEITRAFDPSAFDQSNLAAYPGPLYSKSAAAVNFTHLNCRYRYAANQLYCVDLRMPLLFDPLPHFLVTMCFEIDAGFSATGSQGDLQFWVRHPLNQGYQYIPGGVGGGNKPIPFVSGKGTIHGGQGLLARNGDRLDSTPNATPIYVDTETIPEFDFNSIHIFPGT